MAVGSGRFLTGSTMGHVMRMTLTGSFGITFMFLVDAANLFWVSLLGIERLVAALGFAWTIQFFSVSFGIGMMIAVTASVSRFIGAGNMPEARRQVTVCAIVAFMMQLLVAGTLFVFRREILGFAGASGETLELAARYLAITVPALPVMALGMVGSAVLRAEGDAYRAMAVTFSSGVVSMIIDPLLIFGFGLGLDGAALAVVTARVLSALLSIYFVVGIHRLIAPVSLPDFRRLFWPFALIAGPAIITQLSTPFGNYVLTSIVAGFGDSAVAGWAVVARLTVLAFGGLFALSGAISGIFGQNYGARDYGRVEATYRDALIFCAVYSLIAWALLAAATPAIISAFGLGGTASDVIRAFTLIAAGGYLFNGALFVANSAFNALDRAYVATMFSWIRDGILLWPVAAFMAGFLAAPGAIYGHALSGIFAGVIAALIGWRYVKSLGRGLTA